ncbi:GTP-binding protein EngB required for normal cell division [Scopulibacillus daqui]|uniref:GTP-binding protein EngB required for normal cell division n=1 Tax=Scopulibacillus daqui TaxID=1469162 RepID=A0ABS2PYQ3_9BACL|nr:SE1561 family protein [Scopulibacillus daqui]MBM7645179.1 GTP-binding protein EngB required for normal cell division [Scopulibacillus daqui]
MGKAVQTKEQQLIYLRQRTKLLAQVVEAIDAETARQSDLENVLKMLNDLKIKVQRFHDDWDESLC